VCDEGIGDLLRAARLAIEQIRLQVVAQEHEGERAEQHEDDRQDAGIPGDQAETQGAGIHRSGVSPRP
jgi:hypothetical protein